MTHTLCANPFYVYKNKQVPTAIYCPVYVYYTEEICLYYAFDTSKEQEM